MRKRGLLGVVLILILVVGMVVSVDDSYKEDDSCKEMEEGNLDITEIGKYCSKSESFCENIAGTAPMYKCPGIQVKDDSGEESTHGAQDIEYCSGCDDDGNHGWGWMTTDYCEGSGGGDKPLPGFSQGDLGCYVAGVDLDEGDDDACGYGIAQPGSIIYSTSSKAVRFKSSNVVASITFFGDDHDAGDIENIFNIPWYSDSSGLCAMDTENNFYWYLCRTNVHFGHGVVAKSFDFEEVQNNDNDWLFRYKGMIKIESEVTTANGETEKTTELYFCLDNEEVDTSSRSKTRNWYAEEELGDNDEDGVPNLFDCAPDDGAAYPKYKCKIKKDSQNNFLLDDDGNKVEECEVDPYAAGIVQCGDGKDNDCSEWSTQNYVYDDPSLDEKCGEDKVVCEMSGGSWIDSNNNNCCGDNPSEDIGFVSDGRRGNLPGNFICLSKESYVVEENTAFAEGGVQEAGGWDNCENDWCWVEAGSDARFKIFTVKKTDSSNNIAYHDVVSNGKRWIDCREQDVGFSLIMNTEDEFLFEASQFYCYQEGEHYSFAQCLDKNVPAKHDNGLKARTEGDGLFQLRPKEEQSESSSLVVFEFEEMFKEIYPSQLSADLSSYQNMDFTLTFTENLLIPVEVEVKITPESGDPLVIKALQHVVNTPLLIPGKKLHFKVPLTDLSLQKEKVKEITISATPEQNTFAVSNVYLSKQGEEGICSGERSRQRSSWLSNYNFYDQNSISAEQICVNTFGEEAWMGDLPTAQDLKRCCGDIKEEYYPGFAENAPEESSACWNSYPINNGESFTTVEYEVNEIIFSYTCPSTAEECIFPASGNTPYKVTNFHPGLYDLYYKDEDKETLITKPKQSFDKLGNVIARKIPGQVVYVHNEEEQGFFGCQVPDYLQRTELQEQNYCDLKGNYYCAYTYNKEGKVVVNSWNSLSLTHYQDLDETSPEESFSIQENEKFTMQDLVQKTSIMPGRNLIPNAELKFPSTDQGWARNKIPYWNIFVNGELNENLRQNDYYREEDVFTLPFGQILRSDNIPVDKNTLLSFSQEESCAGTRIHLLDNSGQEVVVESSVPSLTQGSSPFLSNFNSEEAIYLFIEFRSGYSPTNIPVENAPECKIKNAMLQIKGAEKVDFYDEMVVLNEEGKVEKDLREELNNVNFRAPLACCPKDYCWNGFVCVAPMDKYTDISEKAGNFDYRCSEGQWEKVKRKYDWNNKNSGFCQEESQCFVFSSQNPKVNTDASYEAFYAPYDAEVGYPACVKDQEYVFDNYCDNGEWSSRTKFLAEELLGLVEESDHQIYCTKYQEAIPQDLTSSPIFGGVNVHQVTGETTCFAGLDENLVKAEDNKCVNNVCLLKKGEDTYFAATLNGLPGLFLGELGLTPADLESCSGEFSDCRRGNLYYSKKLNALIYGKESFRLNSLGNSVWDFIKSLFTSASEIPIDEILEKAKFRRFFSLKEDGRQIFALQEFFPGETKEKMTAYYADFETPICEFVDREKIGLSLSLISEPPALTCDSVGENLWQVSATEELDFFWPELTGKIRS